MYTKATRAALYLGYESPERAVIFMRLNGLTMEEISERMGVCVDTVRKYIPKNLRTPGGELRFYNRSRRWYEVHGIGTNWRKKSV